MHGARAKIQIAGGVNSTSTTVGIFNSISYGLAYDAVPINTVGRFSAQEIVYTGQDVISVQASGFRVVGAGAHTTTGLPALQDLLNADYVTIVVEDRQTKQAIARIHSVRPTGYSTGVSARNVQEISVSFIGILIDEDETHNNEAADAVRLLEGTPLDPLA